MAENRKRRLGNITDEEKKKIAREMIEGYRKMADLNLELAEEGMDSRDETA
ncbi:MAG: hypothetical protein GX336_03505 [Halanaerobiaceae bacterium]|nr:hypothetical protein [Halanaerobiaceae bacterium]